MEAHSKRILLTGANGFSGYHLKPMLESNGYLIYPLKSDITQKANIIDELKEIDFTYVIHLAAISFVPSGMDTEVYKVNLFGTQNLLEALAETQKNLKKVIIASTSNVYGNQNIERLSETCTPKPESHYALSKYCAEQISLRFNDSLPIIITRPFNYTGIKQANHFLIPKLISHFAQKSKSITLGNVSVSRDFSDVGWICEAYTKLLEIDTSGEIVNLCRGESISICEILNILEEISGHKIDIVIDDSLVRKNEIENLCGDSNKLYNLVPNLSKQVSLQETLSIMYQYALKSQDLC